MAVEVVGHHGSGGAGSQNYEAFHTMTFVGGEFRNKNQGSEQWKDMTGIIENYDSEIHLLIIPRL